MRRKDRQVTDPAQLAAIMDRCEVCRLAFFDVEFPYIVPMNFGFERADGQFTLYFHCAGEGKKLALLSRDSRVGFEMDCSQRLVPGARACDYTMEFESVCGCGQLARVEDADGKRKALRLLMRRYAPDREFSFPEGALQGVTVLALTVVRITGKALKKTAEPS